MLVDTVGFVSNLPHSLVKAFASTLEETLYSNVIIHLKDISDMNKEIHTEVVNDTLKELGVKDIPIIEVYNKCDLINDEYILGDYALVQKNI